MPRMPFSGVRISCDTMARKRDLARLAASACVARFGQRAFGLDAVGDVAADALHLGVLGLLGPDHDFAPGEPARAVGGHDLLVVQPRAVRQHAGAALLQRRRASDACRPARRAAVPASAQ